VASGINIITTKTNGPRYIFKKGSLIWCKIKSVDDLNNQINNFINMSVKNKTQLIKNSQNDILSTDENIIYKKIINIIF